MTMMDNMPLCSRLGFPVKGVYFARQCIGLRDVKDPYRFPDLGLGGVAMIQ